MPNKSKIEWNKLINIETFCSNKFSEFKVTWIDEFQSNRAIIGMRFLAIAVLLLSIEYLSAQSHDDDDDDDMSAAEAFKLLCAADENHMEELYSYCQRTELKDAVRY